MSKYSIILVHLGNDFFDYILDCIVQIKKFNDCDVYFCANQLHEKQIEGISVNFIPLESLEITKKHEIFNSTTSLDRNFRGGFWKFATERFFIIEEVMSKFNLTNVFHLENDNLIYFNIADKIDLFIDNYEIGAILDNDQRCIPGFLYLKDINSISKLTEFILERNGRNDMELIADFKRESNMVKNLPVIPKEYDDRMTSNIGGTTNNPEDYYHNIDLFNSIFDGAAIGQYVGGVDPRNQGGDTTGFINESSLFDVSKFVFEFDFDNENRKIPFLIYKNQKYKINNLHIHSKNLKKFM
jgi:hypothetical protein